MRISWLDFVLFQLVMPIVGAVAVSAIVSWVVGYFAGNLESAGNAILFGVGAIAGSIFFAVLQHRAYRRHNAAFPWQH